MIADIKEEVLRRLACIEREHDVEVLFAVESGSRVWGFASPDSDYDVRFVYRHRPEWYQSLWSDMRRDVIEPKIVDDIDLSGWDVRKALRLFRKSNPSFVEWTQSPIIYVDDGVFLRRAREVLPAIYSPRAGYEHYRSMAKANQREHLSGDSVKLKKYLYVIRALLARKYVLNHRLPPPLPILELLPMFGSDYCAKAALLELIERKATVGELGTGEPLEALNDFISGENVEHVFKETRDDREADRLVEELYATTVYGRHFRDNHNNSG